jgi:hypothetical protein
MQIAGAILLSVAILGAALIVGGRYQAVQVQDGVLVTDRFTGRVQSCTKAKCESVDTFADTIEQLHQEFGSKH